MKALPAPQIPAVETSALLGIVQDALGASRLDLYLQPIVRLPQRRIHAYECLSRIRGRGGEILTPAAYWPTAESHGLTASIDNLILFRCVQLIRRTRQKTRHMRFFINLAMRSLEDGDFIDQFLEFLGDNPDLREILVFELAQPEYSRLSPPAEQALSRMEAIGCRFSLDHVQSLAFDWDLLARARLPIPQTRGGGPDLSPTLADRAF